MQQEHRPGAADPVVGVGAVEASLRVALLACSVASRAPRLGDHVGVVAEADGRRRARLRAGRGLAVAQPVVAERALLGDASVRHRLAAVPSPISTTPFSRRSMTPNGQAATQ
jgi:hypothetical protein